MRSIKLISRLYSGILTILIIFFLILISGFAFQIVSDQTSFTSALAHMVSSDNFHEVRPGELYRSAKLSNKVLEEKLVLYGIKNVIDLRLGGDREEGESSEKALVKKNGSRYIWLPLNGSNTRQKKAFKRLIKIAEEINGPVLVHCTSGTHRSGIVTALLLHLRYGISIEEASKQLSPKFGFFYQERRFKSLINDDNTIDKILWDFVEANKKTGISFKEWLDLPENFRR
ncbi:MAG TPA: tyrosine-protein phosphatase [Oligoflexia bacterium]|nr:tyrosine-protein phosphatase [Oligoflexia bacterium]HMP47701.1 tyrosine-protein phosphatase [Oligoflexia bacterium]